MPALWFFTSRGWIVRNTIAEDHALPRRRAQIFDARSAFNLGVTLNWFPGAAAPYQEPAGWNEFRPPIRRRASSPAGLRSAGCVSQHCCRTTWKGFFLFLAPECLCARTYRHKCTLIANKHFFMGLLAKSTLWCDQYCHHAFRPCPVFDLNVHKTSSDSFFRCVCIRCTLK